MFLPPRLPACLPARLPPCSIKVMYNHVNPKNGEKSPLIDDKVFEVIMQNAEKLDSEIVYDRDFDYDYFGFKVCGRVWGGLGWGGGALAVVALAVVAARWLWWQRAAGPPRLLPRHPKLFLNAYLSNHPRSLPAQTLERSYLLRVNGRVVERPQHMLMRVSVGIHMDDIDSVVETYHLLSQRWFTHASPTLFNAGTPRPQLSSCFLVTMKNDSIEGEQLLVTCWRGAV